MRTPRKHIVLLAVTILTCGWADFAQAEVPDGEVTALSEHLVVYRGPINVGIIRQGANAFLIDCGEGSVAEVLPQLGIAAVQEIWFTHHHRDQACGASRFATSATRFRVPAAERTYFDNLDSFWHDPRNRWSRYDIRPNHLVLAEPIRVDAELKPGETLVWGPAKITVINTPGHTDGSLSYLVEVDGKRVAFCGDAIYDAGQLWELWSLQDSYMSFLFYRGQLVDSLKRIQAARPDLLVPSHGRIIEAPSRAVDLLSSRLDAANDCFLAISGARVFSTKKQFSVFEIKPGQMPIRAGKPAPDCLRRIGETTWVLISKEKAAFVIDCGYEEVIKALQDMLAKGEIHSVEGLWITHYHGDHCDAVPAFRKAFPNCPCITDSAVADVIGNPRNWQLPCLSSSQCRVDRVTKDGESWRWHEFKLTAYNFPGQTLYHSGLFVEGPAEKRGQSPFVRSTLRAVPANGDCPLFSVRMFFAGDSLTMSGIDDYHMPNRNWLGKGVGFDRCIALMQELRPTHIFHCHQELAFDFTEEECRLMRANLARREKLFGELVPWDHANYGMDFSWVRCDPYERKAKAGDEVTVEVVITNHSARPRMASCRAILPRVWDGRGTDPAWPPKPDKETAPAAWPTTEVPAKREGRVRLSLRIPPDVKPGRYIIPIDVRYDRWALPQFTEAVVELKM